MAELWDRTKEILADGPIEREALISRLMVLVPPGVAYRQVEDRRRRRQEAWSGHATERVKAREVGDVIRSGQRKLAVDTLSAARLRGKITEQEGPAGVMVRLVPTPPPPPGWTLLTEQHGEILRDYVAGISGQTTADRLGISRSTVSGHRRYIARQLEVPVNREAVAARAKELGLLD